MLERFQKFIEDNKLCSKNDKVLLALSGGPDSVVLLMLFLKSGYDVGIAHCNFKLRGEESDTDEAFVRSLAAQWGIPFFVKAFNTRKYASENKLGIQEAARNLRYAWFEELLLKESFDRLAIAHHSNDQLETFFINLFRGSGLGGLKGMPLKRGKIIRPLLFATRAEIEQFASGNSLQFREDSSNTSDKYLRNRIRNQLLPVVEKTSPQAKKSIANSMQHLQEDALLLQQLLTEKRERLFIPVHSDANQSKGKNLTIKIDELMKLNPLEVWLFYLLQDFGFNRETTNGLAFVLQNDRSSNCGKLFHSTTHRLLIDRERLILQRGQPETASGEFIISAPGREMKTPVHLRLSIWENQDNYLFEANPSLAYFDLDKLQFPLKLRRWKQGDRFVPFGMKGSKLISDYFTDNKIDRFTKENTWLLLSGEDIIWIIGHRASETFRVRKGCSRILKVQLVVEEF